ncbi:MAG TPA: hypothetical protein VND93_02030, partial [Myxococcales bacterium]|nr:hypothetical protein [Myxococcales bacterium]
IVRRQLEFEVVVLEGHEPVAASSPHPGYDRLRRLAVGPGRAQGKGPTRNKGGPTRRGRR